MEVCKYLIIYQSILNIGHCYKTFLEESFVWCVYLHKNAKTTLFLNQKYTMKLFIAFKMAYSCFFSKGECVFYRFPPKKFFNIDYRSARISPEKLWASTTASPRSSYSASGSDSESPSSRLKLWWNVPTWKCQFVTPMIGMMMKILMKEKLKNWKKGFYC